MSDEYDLTNKEFEAWLEKYLKQTPTPNADVVKNFPWSLLPFVSWNHDRPIRLRVLLKGAECKCTLRPMLTWAGLQVTVADCGQRVGAYDPGSQPIQILRYRHHGSKRWRSPKVCHEAQSAYYTLRFK
jgi:hypothetical protein